MIKKPSQDVVQTEVCGIAKRHSAVNLQVYEKIRRRVFDVYTGTPMQCVLY